MKLRSLIPIVIALIVLNPVHALNKSGANSNSPSPICPKPLKIGVSLPLIAGAASSGNSVKNSIVLASEKYDPKGCVQFIFEDDQLLAKNTLTVVNKLIMINHVDGLIVYGTPTSIAVGELVERRRIPMIALSILNRVVRNKAFIMKHWCAAERLNGSIVAEIQRRGYKRLAIISSQNDAMLGLRDLLVRSNVVTVVQDDEFSIDTTDFSSSIVKIISRKVDAIYVLLYPPQTGLFVKKLREAGFKGEAFGVHNIEDPQELKIASGAMRGMWFANGDDSVGDNYRSDYTRRFGEEPALGGASGYDAAKMFIEAAKNNSELNTFLHNLKSFQGAFGVYNATVNNDFDFEPVIKLVDQSGFTVCQDRKN